MTAAVCGAALLLAANALVTLASASLPDGPVIEQRLWRESVTFAEVSCELALRADYLPPDPEPLRLQPARFVAESDCFPAHWQSPRALRVLLKSGVQWFAVTEDFSCLVLQQPSASGWQPCALRDVPAAGLFRRVWGPVRVASAELRAMQDAEQRLLRAAQGGSYPEAFSDTWSEQLWVLRFCGKISETVHHFERWTACREKMLQEMLTIFQSQTLAFPAFGEATRQR